MAKKEAAGDVDIDLDSLVNDAMQTTTGITYNPIGGSIAESFLKKKKNPEKGMRSEAASRLISGGEGEVSDSFDKKIKSGQLPGMEE